TAPVGLCFMDTDLRFVRINEQLAAINGQPVSSHLGTHLRDIIPEIAAGVEPIYHRVIASGEAALNFEVHGITPADPTVERDWMVSYYPVKSADGTMLGVSTVMQNITERKQVEEALWASEERYRTLVEGSMQGLYIHQDGIMQFANAALAKVFGYESLQELIGQDYRILVAPQERIRLEGYRTARLRGELAPSRYEYQGVRKDGTLLWLECMVSMVSWKTKPAILVTFLDITARKQAEEVLRNSEKRFRNLVEGSIQGIVIHQDFKPLFANQAYADMHGYETPEDILLMDTVLPLIAPHERDWLTRYKDARLQGAKDVPTHYEHQGVRKDGTLFWVEGRVRVVTWGGVLAVQSTTFDITERKRAEEALREREEQFRHLVEGSIQGILIHRGHKPLFINQTWAALHGYTPEDRLSME
ncbi:MAG: PAS domain S-box protein, partial [Candidatus Tectomicrobia bacterium]